MRTTLNIDDDLFPAVKSIAAVEHKTVGQIVSALIRKALFARDYDEHADDIPKFRISENAKPLTSEMVHAADEDSP